MPAHIKVRGLVAITMGTSLQVTDIFSHGRWLNDEGSDTPSIFRLHIIPPDSDGEMLFLDSQSSVCATRSKLRSKLLFLVLS